MHELAKFLTLLFFDCNWVEIQISMHAGTNTMQFHLQVNQFLGSIPLNNPQDVKQPKKFYSFVS